MDACFPSIHCLNFKLHIYNVHYFFISLSFSFSERVAATWRYFWPFSYSKAQMWMGKKPPLFPHIKSKSYTTEMEERERENDNHIYLTIFVAQHKYVHAIIQPLHFDVPQLLELIVWYICSSFQILFITNEPTKPNNYWKIPASIHFFWHISYEHGILTIGYHPKIYELRMVKIFWKIKGNKCKMLASMVLGKFD